MYDELEMYSNILDYCNIFFNNKSLINTYGNVQTKSLQEKPTPDQDHRGDRGDQQFTDRSHKHSPTGTVARADGLLEVFIEPKFQGDGADNRSDEDSRQAHRHHPK